ncbi:MAG: DUF433 domain-containing protein [Dehalococcoidia bacterium]|nr:DUF433 domain-containing protein [Dehalococcoidia bacterium]
MDQPGDVVTIDPEVLGGEPVFSGTRVPIRALFDYIEGGEPLAEFLEDFPSVTRAQANAVLEQARVALVGDRGARSAG